jgi:1,4-alpha-glucan branching enzyme
VKQSQNGNCWCNTEDLGDIFFFSKQNFAGHTNNVVNYCESHDEHSIPHEIHFTPALDNPAAKGRKGRLGLLSTMVALGQPMIYMGQEFNTERPRNIVTVQWPQDLGRHGFFQWAYRLIHLRKRYPALRLSGYNPADDGRFIWIIGPWMAANRGGGLKVIGWRSRPTQFAHDAMVIMLNFENHPVQVDVDFGIPGMWVKLADIDRANDIPPLGTNSISDHTAIRTNDGNFDGFTLPGSSGFIYKWEAP